MDGLFKISVVRSQHSWDEVSRHSCQAGNSYEVVIASRNHDLVQHGPMLVHLVFTIRSFGVLCGVRIFLASLSSLKHALYCCTGHISSRLQTHKEETIFDLTLKNLQLQLHTTHLLQLQITFYNCRNCDQLHVKICPVTVYMLMLSYGYICD